MATSTQITPAEREQHMGLCEAIDRLLHKGAVLKGEITISVANIDLVYLGFHVLLASVDTARDFLTPTLSEIRPTERRDA